MTQLIKILSDYTPANEPNFLHIIQDEQGDVHIALFKYNENERGVRIAASGSRYSVKVRKAFYDLVEAYEEEIRETHNQDIKRLNPRD